MTLLDLLAQDGVALKKVAGTHGGEYAGPCPSCGGTDRFRVWPEQGSGGRYWCRGCKTSGDDIQYLKDFRGLPYLEACRLLGREPSNHKRPSNAKRRPHGTDSWKPKESTLPGDQWVKEAGYFVEWAEKELWTTEQGEEAQAWLHERGLKDDTIKAFRLGWNSGDWWPRREKWGLPTVTKENGKPKKLALPAGLVIPKLQNGRVVRVRIRRTVPYRDSRYWTVSGSNTGAMSIPGEENGIVLVVESDLDAMLIWQEAGDLVTVVSLGSAQARPDQEALRTLQNAKEILVALDMDDAGAKEAWQWWNQRFAQARRWPPIAGKDPGEMFQAGVDPRLWVQAGLSEIDHCDPLEVHEAIADAEPEEPNSPSKESTHFECDENPMGGIVSSKTHRVDIPPAPEGWPKPICGTCRSWTESFPSAPHGICRNTPAKQARFQDRTRTGCEYYSLRPEIETSRGL
ncbi:MAG: hypothetical protein GX422_04575 [Deltaproteobacteria bacterium]|nr:hypothetical protein [Deltaproteobacteria bacterium]